MSEPRQGDVWWAEAAGKRRPVLVITRSDAIPVLTSIIVAPITRTVRGIPTEVHFDVDDGLQTECAASFDNLLPIARRLLTERAATLDPLRHHEICEALSALADCGPPSKTN